MAEGIQSGAKEDVWALERRNKSSMEKLAQKGTLRSVLITRYYLVGLRGTGNVEHMGEKSKVYRVLVGKPEGKRLFEGPKLR